MPTRKINADERGMFDVSGIEIPAALLSTMGAGEVTKNGIVLISDKVQAFRVNGDVVEDYTISVYVSRPARTSQEQAAIDVAEAKVLGAQKERKDKEDKMRLDAIERARQSEIEAAARHMVKPVPLAEQIKDALAIVNALKDVTA